MSPSIRLLRPEQWIKNVFLFIPLFFSGHLHEFTDWWRVLAGFFCFSFCASSVYILNDYRDIENDRLHPVKCKRPLASGEVKPKQAMVMGIGLFILAMSGAWIMLPEFGGLLLFYSLINIAYSLKLKHIPIIDINIIALGFLIRVGSGGVLSSTSVSHWLAIMTYLLALFIALAKRRDDLSLKEKSGVTLRKAIDGYNLTFVNIAMGIMAAVLVVTYILYITSPVVQDRYKFDFLYLSVIPVVTGVMRYLQLSFVMEKTGSPTKLVLKDLFLQLTLLVWLSFFAFAIYFKNL